MTSPPPDWMDEWESQPSAKKRPRGAMSEEPIQRIEKPEPTKPGVTGCNYGSHPFKFQNTFPGTRDIPPSHVHVCTECGATYIRPGEKGCRECIPRTREEMLQDVVDAGLQHAKAEAWDAAHMSLCEYTQMGCTLHTNPYR